MIDLLLVLTKFMYLFIYLIFIEFLLCAKQHVSAKFSIIHDTNKMFKKEITPVPKAFLSPNLQTK